MIGKPKLSTRNQQKNEKEINQMHTAFKKQQKKMAIEIT